MDAFLQKLASKLYSDYGNDMHRVCLVFPNRRASLFLKRHLAALIEKPLWLPKIYTIEDFVFAKSGMQKKDVLYLLVKLYKIYKNLAAEKAQPFEEFMAWGNMLLRDFDELDQYLADGKEVFTYINEAKALQHWNLDGQALTGFETEYLRFYNSLAQCYEEFQQQLLAEKEGYTGLAFKELLQNLSVNRFSEWDIVVFSGFNALTLAEEKLIKFLLDNQKGAIYWDADEYYMKNTSQEAGYFLRKYAKEKTFGQIKWIENDLCNGKKNIEIIGVSGSVGQAKLASSICNNLIDKGFNVNETAIVLVDENTLLPTLNSLPEQVNTYNVTMGLPFKHTNAFSLMESVLDLFANAENNSGRFYHKNIQAVLNHPYILKAFTYSDCKNISTKSFYSYEELLVMINRYSDDLASIFAAIDYTKTGTSTKIIAFLLMLLDNIVNVFENAGNKPENAIKNNSVDIEFIVHARKLCNDLLKLFHAEDLLLTLPLLQKIIKNISSSIKIPFYGEPLAGLQIMGVLETRLLDFKNIIMLSVNEGMLPQGKSQSSFIIDEVRRAFNLPRYHENNAVYAYHFYRLMQRAENVWLLYNTQETGVGSSEKSRFITQILYELPQVNPNVTINQHFHAISSQSQTIDNISINKTPQIISRLHQMCAYGFSPTAISRYTSCNLQFYYANVLGLKEREEISESIDAALLGTILHEVLETVYQSYKNIPYSFKESDTILKLALESAKLSFLKRFTEEEMQKGRNLLVFKVAENMLRKMINAEKVYLQENNTTIKILEIEHELKAELNVNLADGSSIVVVLRGKADRIDFANNTLRIIDYKTGDFKDTDLKISKLEDIGKLAEKPKLLQVILYGMMYKNDLSSNASMTQGVISAKNSNYFMGANIAGESDMNDEIFSFFKNEIEKIIAEILNKDILFMPTDNLSICKTCDFQAFCNRVSA